MSGVGFDYTAFDIFEAPNTRLMDLNIHFVPPDLQSKFDLVTNYGTTEHVLNQMLQCVRFTISPNQADLFTMIFCAAGTTCTAISSTIRESFTTLPRRTDTV